MDGLRFLKQVTLQQTFLFPFLFACCNVTQLVMELGQLFHSLEASHLKVFIVGGFLPSSTSLPSLHALVTALPSSGFCFG